MEDKLVHCALHATRRPQRSLCNQFSHEKQWNREAIESRVLSCISFLKEQDRKRTRRSKATAQPEPGPSFIHYYNVRLDVNELSTTRGLTKNTTGQCDPDSATTSSAQV